MRLGDVLQLQYGKPLPEDQRDSSGQYAVYGANGEKARSNRYLHDKRSIVVGRKGSAGEIKLTEEKFWPLDVTYFTTFDELRYDLKFLYYLLDTLDLPSMARGVKPGINRNDVYALSVNIPGLPEQHRIVALLDEAFAGIATAKANAESALEQSRDVFQSKLDGVFDGGAWPMKPLSATSDIFTDGDWIESKDQAAGGIRLIQTGNVGAGVFKGRESKARYISEATFDRLRCTEIFPGDCLVSRLPDPVGRSCLLPPTESRMITAVDCTIIRFNKQRVLPEFFVNYSLSSAYLRAIRAATTGTTRDRISRSNLGRVPIPTPSLPEQVQIVKELASVEAEVRQLESIYTRKLAALDELKQSMLHQAFSGQL